MSTSKDEDCPGKAITTFDLTEPNNTIFFEASELKEVSGLSPTDQKGVYCAVQDEIGTIYFVDAIGGGGILNKVIFKEKGDFEGVEMVGNTVYAVQSNGNIYEISNWDKPKADVTEYKTALKKSDDVEGLGYDLNRKALLLACKGNPDSATVRKIYAFDLMTKQLGDQPVYTIDPLEVNTICPLDSDAKTDYFSPSGIAIDPKTNDVYVLSSAKKRLVVLDYTTGKIKMAAKLKKSILPQPEGISFSTEGNLLLSSEGKNGGGLLFTFNRKK
jgi:uncharacterized protein YjiK